MYVEKIKDKYGPPDIEEHDILPVINVKIHTYKWFDNNTLFGYHAISQDNLWDFGNDPYFHSKPFSWGICRPNNRSKVRKGTKLFFYTFKEPAGDYYLTDMMKVKDILTQIEAARTPELYCNKEKDTCPYKIKPIIISKCHKNRKCPTTNAEIIKKKIADAIS